MGSQAKFHKGPIEFSGARGPHPRAPESPVDVLYMSWMDYLRDY